MILLDEDECIESPCPENSECINTAGSFVCPCQSGYELIEDMCQGKNKPDKYKRTKHIPNYNKKKRS